MTTLLDANAVLRYLIEDVQDQADAVAGAVAHGAEVTVEVLAECAYVLSGVYGLARSEIAEALGVLLNDVDCDRKDVAACALGLYSGGALDFVDCVLAAEHDERGRDVLTFDRRLRALMGMLDAS